MLENQTEEGQGGFGAVFSELIIGSENTTGVSRHYGSAMIQESLSEGRLGPIANLSRTETIRVKGSIADAALTPKRRKLKQAYELETAPWKFFNLVTPHNQLVQAQAEFSI